MNLTNPIIYAGLPPKNQKSIAQNFSLTWSKNAGKKRIIDIVLEEISNLLAEKIDWNYINKGSRVKNEVRARFAVVYYLRKHTSMTLMSIGSEFKNKYDHSSMLHAISKYEDSIELYKEDRRCHERIEERLSKFNKC